ncbi:MAG: hypothetical protein K0R41_3064, partial [Geminicoccaceae bacterium]|nr:hypothetical protein [Geminicoccaceae bacterium]
MAIQAQPATAWRPEGEDAHAVRPWAEVPYGPSDGVATMDRPDSPRYLTVRITKRRGEFVRRRQRARPDLLAARQAGRVEHSDHLLTNELAAE